MHFPRLYHVMRLSKKFFAAIFTLRRLLVEAQPPFAISFSLIDSICSPSEMPLESFPHFVVSSFLINEESMVAWALETIFCRYGFEFFFFLSPSTIIECNEREALPPYSCWNRLSARASQNFGAFSSGFFLSVCAAREGKTISEEASYLGHRSINWFYLVRVDSSTSPYFPTPIRLREVSHIRSFSSLPLPKRKDHDDSKLFREFFCLHFALSVLAKSFHAKRNSI